MIFEFTGKNKESQGLLDNFVQSVKLTFTWLPNEHSFPNEEANSMYSILSLFSVISH